MSPPNWRRNDQWRKRLASGNEIGGAEMVAPKSCDPRKVQSQYKYHTVILLNCDVCPHFLRDISQRWSRGHKARGQGQGHKKNPRPRTAFLRTDTLEAKNRNARGQGQAPRTQVQVLSKKKRSSQKFFWRSQNKKKKKRSSQKFFKRAPQKNVIQKIFQALDKILTIQKILLSSSRGQANFRGLEASRPRTSKCVLEDSTSDKSRAGFFDVLIVTWWADEDNAKK